MFVRDAGAGLLSDPWSQAFLGMGARPRGERSGTPAARRFCSEAGFLARRSDPLIFPMCYRCNPYFTLHTAGW